jgi:lysophospholipase L1-like esterase
MFWRIAVSALVAGLVPTAFALAQEKAILVLNKGVGGSTTRDLLKSFAASVEALHPQHVVLFVGMNDAGNTHKLVPIEEYEANLITLIAKIRGVGARPYLAAIHSIVEAEHASRHKKELLPPEGMNKKLEKFNHVIMKVAEAQKVPVIRFDQAFQASGGARKLTRNKENMSISDGVHLTADGYRLLAQTVFRTLRDKVQPGETVVCLGDSLTFGSGVPGQGTATGQTYPALLSAFLNDVNPRVTSGGQGK